MMIGTCRTELSLQLGMMDPSVFAITDADLPERLAPFVDPDDVEPVTELVRRSNPDASAAEVLFTVATARGYWRDSVLQTEHKAAQAAAGGAPVWSYRLLWRTPVEGGRRISPHNLDLPFVFDNVDRAPHIIGPPTDETDGDGRRDEPDLAGLRPHRRPQQRHHPHLAALRHRPRARVLHLDVPPVVVDDPFRDERLLFERYETQQARGGVIHRAPVEG